jgi:hypothetical protein
MKILEERFEAALTSEELVAHREQELLDAEAARQRLAQEKAEAEARRRASAKPGESIEGEGVFVSRWSPGGGKEYYVFAAPEDLRKPSSQDTWTFEEAALYLSRRKAWHGHDGVDYRGERELLAALEGDKYKGEWFIPPVRILSGYKPHLTGASSEEGNLYGLQHTGAFEGTFSKDQIYWSCTEVPQKPFDSVAVVGFSDVFGFWREKTNRFRCRPCRLVPVP